MAPQTPLDPERIDISLDLVGEGSLAAVQQLTHQLSIVSDYMANIQARTPEGAAAGARIIGNSLGANRGIVTPSGAHPYGSNAAKSPVIANNAGAAASRADHDLVEGIGSQPFRRRFRNSLRSGGGLRGAINQELDIYGATERLQAQRRGSRNQGPTDSASYGQADPYDRIFSGYGDVTEQSGGPVSGMPSSGASLPEGATNPTEPLWMRTLKADPVAWEHTQDGLRLPPGGLSLNLQDKMRIASDFLARSSARSVNAAQQTPAAQAYQTALSAAMANGYSKEYYDANIAPLEGVTPTDISGVATTRGTAAALLRYGADRAAPLIQLSQDIRQRATAAYNFAGATQQMGVQAGFERAGQINIPGTNIGITNPIDFLHSGSAAREGLNQRINTMRLRLMGGINGTQASEIVQGLVGSGWSGEQGQNAAFDAIAPLVQQGQNPNLAVGSFDYAMRQGNASMRDFVDTMSDLGTSARAANMSLDEYQQGLMEFAQQARSLGATGVQGMQLGRNLTDALGVAPQVASQMLQSPMVQAFAMRQGVLPTEIGMMGSSGVTSALYGGMEMAMQASRSFLNQPTVRDAAGNVITGEQRQMNNAAQIMGMSHEEFQRLWRNRQGAQHGAIAGEMLNRYSRNIRTIDQQVRHGSSSSDPRALASIVSGAHGSAVAMAERAAQDQGARGEIADELDARIDRSQWTPIDRELRRMAPARGTQGYDKYMSQIHNIEGKTGQDRVKAAREFIAEHGKVTMPSDQPVVYLKAKGALAKLVEQVGGDGKSIARQHANSGGESSAAQALLTAPANVRQDALNDYLKSAGIDGGG
jgi:hypothetical protein